MAKKTWNEKLQNTNDMPRMEYVGDDPRAVQRYGGGNMLIAAPLEYDAVMKRIPEGKLITTVKIREYLAKKHGADFTCPLTAGIFVSVVANAVEERGGVDHTPYWRTVKKDGELCEKYPGGLDGHEALLRAEGHNIIKKGKKLLVENYEQALYNLE